MPSKTAASLTPGKKISTSNLTKAQKDAFLAFQDLCLLTNGDSAEWLKIPSLSKLFGFELIESVLEAHDNIFLEVPEFNRLIKDRVCPLVIRTFSDKTSFPLTSRLLRVIIVLICDLHPILVCPSNTFSPSTTKSHSVIPSARLCRWWRQRFSWPCSSRRVRVILPFGFESSVSNLWRQWWPRLIFFSKWCLSCFLQFKVVLEYFSAHPDFSTRRMTKAPSHLMSWGIFQPPLGALSLSRPRGRSEPILSIHLPRCSSLTSWTRAKFPPSTKTTCRAWLCEPR